MCHAVDDKYRYELVAVTFSYKMACVIHEAELLTHFVVDGFVFGELVNFQMLRQTHQLLLGQRFA